MHKDGEENKNITEHPFSLIRKCCHRSPEMYHWKPRILETTVGVRSDSRLICV